MRLVLGRTVQTQLQSDSVQTASATNPTPATSYIDISYDGFGRIVRQSNPYRSTSDPTYGFTSYTYDALGRPLLQCNPDNGNAGGCVAGRSYREWNYAGNLTTFYDELRNSWQRTTDVLGRLTKVIEPGNLQTLYSYDGLNNLTGVTQSGSSGETARARSFTYDSLSRLMTATNPETGTITYGYDSNGNLLAKTDARGKTVSYTYDALNRMTYKSALGRL